MADTRDDRDTTTPEAKRDGREGVDPESMPGEYADEMRVNRFTPPPPPGGEDGERDR